jgi:hypothetical protein
MSGECHVIWTTAFPIDPGEDAETNPGRYGRAFAQFVADGLRAKGELVEDIIPEDFGWCVRLGRNPSRWIGCGNRDGETEEWMAFAVVEAGLLGRLFGKTNIAEETSRLSRCRSHKFKGFAPASPFFIPGRVINCVIGAGAKRTGTRSAGASRAREGVTDDRSPHRRDV